MPIALASTAGLAFILIGMLVAPVLLEGITPREVHAGLFFSLLAAVAGWTVVAMHRTKHVPKVPAGGDGAK